MKLAAIDIGTNSMRLLICDYINGQIINRKKFVNTTRIGKGVDENGFIREEVLKINLDALKEYYEISKKEGCKEIYCIGTSALRDSKNGDDFVKRAKLECNVNVEIISGNEESSLGFLGVLKGADADNNDRMNFFERKHRHHCADRCCQIKLQICKGADRPAGGKKHRSAHRHDGAADETYHRRL